MAAIRIDLSLSSSAYQIQFTHWHIGIVVASCSPFAMRLIAVSRATVVSVYPATELGLQSGDGRGQAAASSVAGWCRAVCSAG